MEWLLGGSQLQNTGSQLGIQVGNSYCVQDTCLETLGELLSKLASEDRTLRTFRRALGFSQIIQKDLVPLLIHEKDDVRIVDAVVRLLVNLTIPVECLLPMEIMARSDAGRHTIFELNSLLAAAKEAFIEPRSTRSVLQFIKRLLESEEQLTLEQCEGINNCLLLVRNILHIPEPWPSTSQSVTTQAQITTPSSAAGTTTSTPTSKQNTILWNLFAQGVDKVLIHLMTSPQKNFWSITMVQLIALTYKDQHVGTLQKLLNLWFESSFSESSDDNESNTSPQKQCSGDSSPMLTSDPTSDSSDNSSGSTSKNGNASESIGVVKHVQRGHSLERNKNGIKTIECTSSRGKRRKAQTTKFVDMTRKTQPTCQGTSGAIRSKSNQGICTKTQQHKKERQYEEQQQISRSDQEHITSETKFSMANRNIIVNQTTNSPPFETSSTNVQSVNSPASSSSGVSSVSVDSTAPGYFPHSCAVPVSHKNGGKRVCAHSSSELSDCGYGTQVENRESVSTSSNEDELPQNANNCRGKPVHQKPPCSTKLHNRPHKSPMSNQEKQDWRRKKLVKRSCTNILNIKALMHHIPTDEDISHLLKEFTIDFLLKGYGPLVQELHTQMLSELGTPVDTSHFFWLVTYFLKFAAQLDLGLECISPILSYKVMSYLTFEGVNLCEQLQLALLHQETDLKPCLRRLHLVVTAIREFLQALDIYKKSSHLSIEDKELLSNLKCQMSATSDLRNLFVMLLRHFNPGLQSMQYLQDLICTNHILLLSMEQDGMLPCNMVEHCKQFATAEMMQQYGRLLENFRENSQFVNDCVFTMMHHISGDLNQVSVLFQPGILKTFSLIWEEDFNVCDDWSDLIEYVIHKFFNTPRRGHPMLPLGNGCVSPDGIVPGIATPNALESNMCRWTKEECDMLYWYHEQSTQCADLVGNILSLYTENQSTSKTRVGIIEQLYTQDIIPHTQYLELLKLETVGLKNSIGSDAYEAGSSGASTSTAIAGTAIRTDNEEEKRPDDITSLIDFLLAENHAQQLRWLQMLLLESCFIKLNNCDLLLAAKHIMEPVPYHYIMMRQSIPLVPWNLEQSTLLSYPPFVLLLHKLGFHLPTDVGKVFPRIPHFWTAEVLYETAQKLGSVPEECVKFDVNQLNNHHQEIITSIKDRISGMDNQNSIPYAEEVLQDHTNLSTGRVSIIEASQVQDLDSNISKMSISEDGISISEDGISISEDGVQICASLSWRKKLRVPNV